MKISKEVFVKVARQIIEEKNFHSNFGNKKKLGTSLPKGFDGKADVFIDKLNDTFDTYYTAANELAEYLESKFEDKK
jgi:hypothetical protein